MIAVASYAIFFEPVEGRSVQAGVLGRMDVKARLEHTYQRRPGQQGPEHADRFDVRRIMGRRQVPVRLHRFEDIPVDQHASVALPRLDAFEADAIHLPE